jgi:protease I
MEKGSGKRLAGKKVAILATDGFEQSELVEPRKALLAAGATCHVISPKSGPIKGWKGGDWGDEVDVDRTLREARADDYEALLIPGGVKNPDTLRMNTSAIAFVEAFVRAQKPIAAICHGPQLLIETGMVRGRRMTSYPSLKTDLKNAGATWVDEQVVVDRGLVTSRNPDDIPAFNEGMIDLFATAIGERQGKRTNGAPLSVR